MKVLVVEDEENIARLVRLYLESDGFQVVTAVDGKAALEHFERERPDLVVLDLLLPKVDGLEVCRRIRSTSFTPILMLTARRDEVDRILGLEMGADDYLTKPFSPREMVTRVKAILRRTRQQESHPPELQLRFEGLTIDVPRRTVDVRGRVAELTAKEFDLLVLMASSPGVVFSRETLLSRVWKYEYLGDARTVDVHIGTLRKKIEENSSSPRYVKTVWGVGYKFEPPSVA